MSDEVRYDFAAADRLSQQLAQLASKIEWLVWLRQGRRGALLGSEHSDNWQGVLRGRFERAYGREQSELTHLASAARATKAKVDAATAAAHAAQKKSN